MSYSRTGVRVPAIVKPSDAFRLLFVNETEEEKKFNRASVNSSGSILDVIRDDARDLRTALGSEDRQKLEEYFSSMRETEKKLELAEGRIDRPKPTIKDPKMKKVGDGSRDDKTGSNQVEIWLDLMFLALQTDSTRVLTMSIENCNWCLDGVTDSARTSSAN